jgi:PqqD family protein of HPr-rel-A system
VTEPAPSDSNARLGLVQHRQWWRIWEGAVVVFEPLSGDTHRIDHPSGRILKLLTESACSRASIYSSLISEATSEDIDEALNLLLTLELVEPV